MTKLKGCGLGLRSDFLLDLEKQNIDQTGGK